MDKLNEILQPFAGYIELGMYVDAHDVLEKLPSELKSHPSVCLARLELLVEIKKWEDGILLGQSLCELWPQEWEFWFKTAYCQHELKLTQEAKDTLLAAPKGIRDTPVFYYNMACYETQLGNLLEAKGLLKECFARDKAFRQESLGDPDLEPLWNSI